MRHSRGDTIIWRYTHKVYNDLTEEWDYTDCDDNYPKITVTNADSVKRVDAQDMTKVATGKYVFAQTIASDEVEGLLEGVAEGRCTVQYGGNDVILVRQALFNVEVVA